MLILADNAISHIRHILGDTLKVFDKDMIKKYNMWYTHFPDIRERSMG